MCLEKIIFYLNKFNVYLKYAFIKYKIIIFNHNLNIKYLNKTNKIIIKKYIFIKSIR